MRKSRDLIGKKFGRLTVISKVEGSGGRGKHFYFLCKCDCGKTKEIRSSHIGIDVFSCGCLVDRIDKKKDTLFNIYKDMKRRCYSIQRSNYKYYGAKGIRICDEWLNGFQNFREWALSHGYVYLQDKCRGERLSIDRIDPNGNYEPQNCRWIPFNENLRRRLV